MNHEIHSVYSLFWRNAYVAAVTAGHPDPAAAADEAFLAFDCRFGVNEEPPITNPRATGGLAPTSWQAMQTPPTADDLVKQTNELPATTPSVVVRDPSAEVLPNPVPRADDEALG